MSHDKNVFILGAGASKTAGAPMLSDFIMKAREIYDIWQFGASGRPALQARAGDMSVFSRVFEWQNSMSSVLRTLDIDLGNIEDLFSLVDMSDLLGNAEASDIRSALKKVVCRTLEESIEVREVSIDLDSNKPLGSSTHVSLANWLAKRMQDHDHKGTTYKVSRDSIITLNYDTVCEQAIESAIGPTVRNPRAFTYGEPWTKNGADGPACVKVIKLHGSINWGMCSGCGNEFVGKSIYDSMSGIGYQTASEYWLMRPTSKFPNNCPTCQKDTVEPFIVPPTWNKAGYGAELTPVWTAAYQEIKEAARLIIIGYSLPDTDSFFKYLLALGVAENGSLQQIIVVNPDKEAHQRYQNFIATHFKRRSFELREEKFEDWLKEWIKNYE